MAQIAQIANFVSPTSGGLKTALLSLALAWTELGHHVHTIIPGERTQSFAHGPAHVHMVAAPRVPCSGGYRAIMARGPIRSLLADIAPDVMYLSDRTSLLWTADWARERGVPTSLIAHERVDGVLRAFTGGLSLAPVADYWNRRSARRVDSIICTTGFAAEEFTRIGEPVQRVPLGVDLETFQPCRRSAELRATFGANVLLGLISRLSTEKRPGFALEVLRELVERGVDARLVVAGTGPLDARMRAQARGLPVTFLGHLHGRMEMARLLASLDVVLAPGPIETFGLAALEALACGTPVIANADSGIAEVIGGHSGSAFTLDAASWARGVQDLHERSGRVRRAARIHAETFSWKDCATRMLMVHEALAHQDAAP